MIKNLESEHRLISNKTLESTTVAEVVSYYLYKNKLTQNDLCKLLGEPNPRISEFLNGKRKLSIRLAKKFHTYLNISPEFLLTSK